MKLTKMSLVAALLVGSSAFAVDNIKVSGDAQIMYNTTDMKGTTSNALAGKALTDSGTLFDKDSSAADAALHLGLTADLTKNDMVSISAGAKYTAISTLGLENNFVSNVWGGSHTAVTTTGASYASAVGGAKVENASWFNEAYVTVAAGKSILKIGRQELDTPLAFTEKWSVEENTFEAAAFINQDIPDTTIVAAYVGTGNGTEAFGQNAQSNVQTLGLAVAPIVNGDGNFATYGTDGAYAYGVVNNSFKPLTVQAWYYDVSKLAQAYWLQADLDASGLGVAGLTAGVQYSSATLESDVATALGASDEASSTTAVMLGYEMKDLFAAKVAYSTVGDKGTVGAANTATSTGASKLYTEAWWNYGYVTRLDTTAFNVTVTSPVNGLFDLGVYYTSADQSNKFGDGDLTEITVTAGKDFGPLNATLALINTDAKDQSIDSSGTGSAYNTVQAYLTYSF